MNDENIKEISKVDKQILDKIERILTSELTEKEYDEFYSYFNEIKKPNIIIDIKDDANIKDYITNLKQNYDNNINKYEELIEKYSNLQEQLHQASLDIQELTEKDLYCPTNCDKLTKLQKENEYLKKNQRFHKRFKEDSIFCLEYDKETLKDLVFELQQRIDKAIEYINTHYLNANEPKLLNILKGDSDE